MHAREESFIFIIPEPGAADLAAAVATIASGRSSFRWISAELALFFVTVKRRAIGNKDWSTLSNLLLALVACGGFIIHSLFEMDLEFEGQADGKSQENIRRYTPHTVLVVMYALS
jgi:hypothetical protein